MVVSTRLLDRAVNTMARLLRPQPSLTLMSGEVLPGAVAVW
jgi:hypothetical protein